MKMSAIIPFNSSQDLANGPLEGLGFTSYGWREHSIVNIYVIVLQLIHPILLVNNIGLKLYKK